jgi:ATP/maltotriose-dependent transcriptional regulator MalT
MLRANALKGAGNLAWNQGDYELSSALLDESLALYRALADVPGVAHVLNTQGLIADARGDYTHAVSLFEESLALWRTGDDVTKIGSLLSNLATVAYHQERYAEAATLIEESLALHRTANNQWSIALSLNNLGEMVFAQGDLARAETLLEESLALLRELGDNGEAVYTLRTLSDVARKQGDLERAAMLGHEALKIACEVGQMVAAVDALETVAEAADSQGRSALATQVFALATALRETHHLPRPVGNDKVCDIRIDDLHASLGDQAFTAAWEQGQSWSLDEAMRSISVLLSAPTSEVACQSGTTSGRTGPRPRTRANPQGLTNRELEVLPLLAEGLRNVDIADRLSTSPRTVEHHVSAVLAKLHARSRAEAVQRAYELGLLPLATSDPAPK